MDGNTACDFLALANPGVRTLLPYPPGKPVEELAREQGLAPEQIIKLASNENPLGPPASSILAMKKSLADMARYPDGHLYNLRTALCEKLSVAPEQLVFGNGSNDVLVLLAESFLHEGCSAVYSQYAFVVYSIAVKASGARSIVVPAKNWGHDLEAMASAVRDDSRMVFLANPNNPTGTSFSESELLSFMAKIPDSVIVVLDEAYFEYVETNGYPNGVSLLKQFPNLVVTRTFSKAYGLAGARVGYGIAHPVIADVLNRLRQPFNVNLPAEAAAVAALNDGDYLQQSRDVNAFGLNQVAAGLQNFGLALIPSAGNFITFHAGMDAMTCYQQLLCRGVIVRPIGNYDMPDYLRVSIGLPEENQRFLDALRDVLEVQRTRIVQ